MLRLEAIAHAESQALQPERAGCVLGKQVVTQCPAWCEPVLAGKRELARAGTRGIMERREGLHLASQRQAKAAGDAVLIVHLQLVAWRDTSAGMIQGRQRVAVVDRGIAGCAVAQAGIRIVRSVPEPDAQGASLVQRGVQLAGERVTPGRKYGFLRNPRFERGTPAARQGIDDAPVQFRRA